MGTPVHSGNGGEGGKEERKCIKIALRLVAATSRRSSRVGYDKQSLICRISYGTVLTYRSHRVAVAHASHEPFHPHLHQQQSNRIYHQRVAYNPAIQRNYSGATKLLTNGIWKCSRVMTDVDRITNRNPMTSIFVFFLSGLQWRHPAGATAWNADDERRRRS